ncbi:hypothetical protein AC579_7467 [Pseudocercospora musae]|uniref:Uncharacterized protein n=1 Tax=Pseudocercospora musae TaxID=113226 RepID=A0A139H7J5_9PEZI|nr:hypothetical protein AC579_7467 [Pseudocercospora musae]
MNWEADYYVPAGYTEDATFAEYIACHCSDKAEAHINKLEDDVAFDPVALAKELRRKFPKPDRRDQRR